MQRLSIPVIVLQVFIPGPTQNQRSQRVTKDKAGTLDEARARALYSKRKASTG